MVKAALDIWVDTNKKPPTPHDIKELCKPKVTIHARLPSPLAIESNKQHAIELKEAVKEMVKPARDKHTAWIFQILENPKKYSDISFKYATQAKAKLGL